MVIDFRRVMRWRSTPCGTFAPWPVCMIDALPALRSPLCFVFVFNVTFESLPPHLGGLLGWVIFLLFPSRFSFLFICNWFSTDSSGTDPHVVVLLLVQDRNTCSVLAGGRGI